MGSASGSSSCGSSLSQSGVSAALMGSASGSSSVGRIEDNQSVVLTGSASGASSESSILDSQSGVSVSVMGSSCGSSLGSSILDSQSGISLVSANVGNSSAVDIHSKPFSSTILPVSALGSVCNWLSQSGSDVSAGVSVGKSGSAAGSLPSQSSIPVTTGEAGAAGSSGRADIHSMSSTVDAPTASTVSDAFSQSGKSSDGVTALVAASSTHVKESDGSGSDSGSDDNQSKGSFSSAIVSCHSGVAAVGKTSAGEAGCSDVGNWLLTSDSRLKASSSKLSSDSQSKGSSFASVAGSVVSVA